jgi:hypothetical protein
MDTMPEIMDGKNVADFIDSDIAEKLEALEREEERLQAEGFYNNDEIIVSQSTKVLFRFTFLICSGLSPTRMMNERQPKRK